MSKKETINYYGTGRRKNAIARVRLVEGSGKITINNKDIDEFFGLETLKVIVRQPLTNLLNQIFLCFVCSLIESLLIFFFIFYNSPSGLLLYWTVSNILTMVQQIYINKLMQAKKAEMDKKVAPLKAKKEENNKEYSKITKRIAAIDAELTKDPEEK